MIYEAIFSLLTINKIFDNDSSSAVQVDLLASLLRWWQLRAGAGKAIAVTAGINQTKEDT